MYKIDFAAVRELFGGSLTQDQVDGINLIIDTWNDIGIPRKDFLAYALATAFHETGQKMQPVTENLYYTSAKRLMEVWPSRFKTVQAAAPYCRNPEKLANKVYGGRLGNNTSGDGYRYIGRGIAQLTGKANYAKFGLADDPEALLVPAVSARVLVIGLLEGKFTKKKLMDYVGDGNQFDARAARATVNADVKANGEKIATYADTFAAALSRKMPADRLSDDPAPIPHPVPERPSPSEYGGVLAPFFGWLAVITVAALLAYFLIRFIL